MKAENAIELMGLNRAISTLSISEKLNDSEIVVLRQAHKFGVDAVYFNTDQNQNSFPAVFLKKVTLFDAETLKNITETHKKIWNYKKVLFLYVYSETEIRIYNCTEKPLIVTQHNFDYDKEIQTLLIKKYLFSDKLQLEELSNLFSTIAIDTGIIWTVEEAEFIRKKINLQRRVDKYLVNSLINTALKLEQQGLEINFIHKVILRSLFLLYLEDRKATDETFYTSIKDGAKSYFDVLDDVEATYRLYAKLETHFNGNVFTLADRENISASQLNLIKKCFISGDDNTQQTKLFENWRLFDFSIIQIELLSEIYENFLFKTDPELKKKTGTYYTPPSLVEFILNEKLPVNKGEKTYIVKVLDPACGSGIFLVECFKRLVKRYENNTKEKLTDFDTLKKILLDNIFGIELHPQALKVAAFSLYLALLDSLNPKTIWQNKNHRLPNLINNPNDKSLKVQGNNLYCRDTISDISTEMTLQNFDLVVGNPPFGKLLSENMDLKGDQKNIRSYCNRYALAKEMVLPFLHKATHFAPNGKIALIFNTKVLTNTGSTYQNFRKWLFNYCYVEKVYNFSILRNAKKNAGGQLFGDATGPISIVYYQKQDPETVSDKLIYYAPKTYIKANIIEGLSIDFSDLKYLPRVECQKTNTQIWKIAMWGSINDWELIKRLSKNYPTIKNFLEKENIDYGVGFELSSPADKPNNEINKLPIHTPDNILKYYTPKPSNRITTNRFRRIGKVKAYQNPHILLNEGIKVDNDTLTVLASFVDYKSAYSKGIVGIYSKENNSDLLKLLTFYFNSDFIKYFSFLTTSSWGIERDIVKHKELFDAPFLLDSLLDNEKKQIITSFEETLLDKVYNTVNHKIENELNTLILNQLSENDNYIIQHLLNNLDLFHKQEKSIALFSVLPEQVAEYAKLISTEINDFLDGQNLFANATIYNINRFTPLMMIKLTFNKNPRAILQSQEFVDVELKKLDKLLWVKNSTNIYFRKKLNYKTDDDIYIIRPNQRRFWSQSMALEDASELILEILNEN